METLFVEILTFILLPLVLSSNFALFETRLLGYVDSLQLPVIAIGVRLVGHVITIEPMNLTHTTPTTDYIGLLFFISNDFCTQV